VQCALTACIHRVTLYCDRHVYIETRELSSLRQHLADIKYDGKPVGLHAINPTGDIDPAKSNPLAPFRVDGADKGKRTVRVQGLPREKMWMAAARVLLGPAADIFTDNKQIPTGYIYT
jgi:hypothetical protein